MMTISQTRRNVTRPVRAGPVPQFDYTAPMHDLPIVPGVVIPAANLSWTAARSTGAGGQHVNKSASKVDLRFDLEACPTLSERVKARIRAHASVRLDADGRVVVVSQRFREQTRNLDDALEKLAYLVRACLVPQKHRLATKPTRSSQRRRLQSKREHSEKKAARSRPQDG